MRSQLAKSVLFLGLLCSGISFAQTATITGTIKDLANAVVTSGKITFTLKPGVDSTIGGTARFLSQTITCGISPAGAVVNWVSGAPGTAPCNITMNTALTPPGTYYTVNICGYYSCPPGAVFNFYAYTVSIDISTIIPTPGTAPSYSFLGINQINALTYLLNGHSLSSTDLADTSFVGRLNVPSTWSAAQTFAGGMAGPLTSSNINAIRYVDGVTFTQNAVGMQAAINDLPSTGGVVDARSMQGAFTFGSSITVGTTNKPVILLLGGISLTFTGADGFVIQGHSSGVLGLGPRGTFLRAGAGFTGSIIRAEPINGSANFIVGVNIDGFQIDLSGAPTATGISLRSVRDPSYIRHVEMRNGTGRQIEILTSVNAGALISQGISISDTYVQAATPKTDNSVVIEGNQVQLGPNLKIISSALEGTFVGLLIRPDSVQPSLNSGGFGNNFFESSVGPYATGILVTSTAGNAGVGSGNVIRDNTLESNTNAGKFTGLDNTHLALNNQWVDNSYKGTVTTGLTIDFGQVNTVRDRTIGAASLVLTANSSANLVTFRANALTDFSDSGVSNVVWVALGNSWSTKRVRYSYATALVSGDFVLSAGWGATASVAVQANSVDSAWQITVTANGAGLAANPTITPTFKDGTWSNIPVCLTKMQDAGTGVFSADIVDVPTATTNVITYKTGVAPVAGNTYVFSSLCVGR